MATGTQIVDQARAEMGKPYVFGATGPDTFDCSGLVQWVYRRYGLSTPRTTYQMVDPKSPLQPIAKTQLQAGDLVFSNWGEDRSSHVAIYTGQGTVIEAPEPGKTVTETPLNSTYWAHVDNLRRVPGLTGSGGTILTGVRTGDGGSDPTAGLIEGAANSVENVAGSAVDAAGSVIGALEKMGAALGSVATSAAEGAGLATQLLKLALPSNLLRLAFLFWGTVWILVGVWLMASAVKD